MKTIGLLLLAFLLSSAAIAQDRTLRWFEGNFPVNTEAGQHSIWYGLGQLEFLRQGDKGFESFIPQNKGDSVSIRYVDEKHIQLALLRDGQVLSTQLKKVRIKEDQLIIRTKWLVRGLPPIIWGLGWRSAKIKRLDKQRIAIRLNAGGVALFGIFPFTVGSPQIEDLILEH